MQTNLLIWNIALLCFVLLAMYIMESLFPLLVLLLVSWNKSSDVTCPKCHHKFNTSDSERDSDD